MLLDVSLMGRFDQLFSGRKEQVRQRQIDKRGKEKREQESKIKGKPRRAEGAMADKILWPSQSCHQTPPLPPPPGHLSRRWAWSEGYSSLNEGQRELQQSTEGRGNPRAAMSFHASGRRGGGVAESARPMSGSRRLLEDRKSNRRVFCSLLIRLDKLHDNAPVGGYSPIHPYVCREEKLTVNLTVRPHKGHRFSPFRNMAW